MSIPGLRARLRRARRSDPETSRLVTDLPNKAGTHVILQCMDPADSSFAQLVQARELAAKVRAANPSALLVQLSGLKGNDARRITEHVLADAEAVGLGVEIRLGARRVGDAHGRVAAQVIHADRPLRALLAIGARRRDNVDRRGADHVDIVVGDERRTRADLLAHQDRRTVDTHTAAFVQVVKNIAAVFGQHAGQGAARQHRTRCPQHSGKGPRYCR